MIYFSKYSSRFLGFVFGATVLLAAQTLSSTADAASCEARAAQVASSTGGQVLTVSSKGSKCIVKVLVKSGNGPPRRRTIVVSK